MTETKRREFLMSALTLTGAVGAGALGTALSAQDSTGKKRKILGINTSHRSGMTCAAGLKIVLDGIRQAEAGFETELVELAGIDFNQAVVGSEQPKDGLDDLLGKIASPDCAGFVIASPVYFGLPSGRCVSFISRLMPTKRAGVLKNKVFGAVAVGAGRNGGQETVLHALTSSMLTLQMLVAVDAPPTSHWGATLWNRDNSIEHDEFGISTAKNLGLRVAELAKLV